MSSPVTTHVLDTAKGVPAAGVRIILDRRQQSEGEASQAVWERVGETVTNEDGRGPGLTAGLQIENGVYRAIFFTQDYFDAQGTPTFYPYVEIVFRIVDKQQHHHIPLLLSPFGYSTYRGS